MSAGTSLRNSRIIEEDDNEPLLNSMHRQEGDLELNQENKPGLNLFSTKTSVIFVVGLVFLFIFILSTVCFGVLYYKISDSSLLAEWPKPSNSLLEAAVATDNELCSEIGRDILLQGGNAVDAAIASLICIGVLDVQSAGLGGGHLMTFYNATSNKCHVIDARESAPSKASQEMFRDKYSEAQFGWKAVAVPGELHGLWTAYKNFGGKVSWKSLVRPTIRLMREGYPTSKALAYVLKTSKQNITSNPTLRASFTNPKTGELYKAGEQITTRQNFIHTLRILANSNDPVKDFYDGNLTKKMIAEFKDNSGIITEEDFRSYKSIIRKDDEVIYADLGNGIRGCGPPPPSGASVTLSILNLLKHFSMDTHSISGNVQLFHRYIEASKFAYAKRSELGDISFVNDSLKLAKNITSNEWSEEMYKLITDYAHPLEYYGGNFTVRNDHGTSHISVIDKYGNAVSLTSTINLYLGAQVMSESTGIVWNDQMDDFSLPGHPNYFGLPPSPANYIKAGKRPQSSMSPIILTSDKMILSIGSAGGSQIISSVAFAAMHILFLNRNVKQAIDFPRLHNQLRPNYTEAEYSFLQKLLTGLEDKSQVFKNSSRMSVITAVLKSLDKSKVYANSDFRKGWESEPSGY